jgi:mRNA interferase RelE/StbE
VFEVVIEGHAERDLKGLERDVRVRVYEALRALAENPHPHGCCKLAGSDSDWRIRVGDYRIIYAIDKTARAVRVMRVRHRREVYR